MKEWRLLRAIGEVDDELIEQAESYRRRKKIITWVAVAACITLSAVLGVWRGSETALASPFSPASSGSEVRLGLPLLPSAVTDTGMGFEGIEVHSAEDYRPLNALADGEELPDTMPVYRNASWLSRPDLDAMEARLWEVAALFGVTEGETVRTDNTPPDEELEEIVQGIEEKGFSVSDQMFSGSVELEADGLRFYATKSGAVRVTLELKESDSLPETGETAAGEFDPDAEAQHLLAEFSQRLGMRQPEAVVTGGNVDINDRVSYEILFAEHADTAAARAEERSLNTVEFGYFPKEESESVTIWYNAYARTEKLGDYPIITPDEALRLLENGNCITTVPGSLPSADDVRAVELVYRAPNEAVYQPYYRFWAQVEPEELVQREGVVTLGAYYVPAVESQYLEELPVWDGSFN